jgi:hypothetical protein
MYLQRTALMSNGYAFFAEFEGKLTDAFTGPPQGGLESPSCQGFNQAFKPLGEIRMMYGYVFPASSGFTDPINGNFAGMIQLIQA